jgi:DNA-binding NtrC family response regulator
MEVIRRFRTENPELAVIAMLDRDSGSAAIAAMKAGCTDVLAKPLQMQDIVALLDRFLPNREVPMAAAGAHEAKPFRIVGCSAQIRETVAMARRAARTSIPVLITGESGTGKELLAALIHLTSARSAGPYIRLNCASVSESLLESELFGHEKGAFTGAAARRKGRFERAHGGTLLFDEITETPLKFQAELLRVIEQQDFERVGGEESVSVNVRIISTTNRDILREVCRGRFREDLYYRLSGIQLRVPPLRERKEDMIPLVWHFVNLYAGECDRRVTDIDPLAVEMLMNYDWPGNVRQLGNVIRAALLLGSGEVFSAADIAKAGDLRNEQLCRAGQPRSLAGRRLHEIEQEAIIATLRQTRGNQTRAARTLGISDRTLREKIKKYRQQGLLQLTA